MRRLIPFLAFVILIVPAFAVVYADQVVPTTPPVISTLTNPLKVNSLGELYKNIFDIIIDIGYVVVAFFLLLSGFKFVTAQGSETKLEDAKSTFYGTIIGAVIVIGAKTIYVVLEAVVKSLNK